MASREKRGMSSSRERNSLERSSGTQPRSARKLTTASGKKPLSFEGGGGSQVYLSFGGRGVVRYTYIIPLSFGGGGGGGVVRYTYIISLILWGVRGGGYLP